MNYIFWTGIIGSLVLVTGAAWPESKDINHPMKSVKDWLFAIGGLLMLIYSIFVWQQGGPIFYMILETLGLIASILMMLNTPDNIDTPILGISSLAFIIWSVYLSQGYNTVIFILGLCGIALGYAFQMGTLRRSVALTIGSGLIAFFSYLEASWIFFWLNVFFAIFSAYYIKKALNLKN